MAEKVTIMVLKVDLQCSKCYRKVKKVLCRYPQIRDQVFNEKANTVTITVVCCSPEKIRDKLCYRGRGTIKSIDIKEPEKKKETDKPKTDPPKPAAVLKAVENPPADKSKDKPKQVTFVDPPKSDSPKPPAKATEQTPAPVPVGYPQVYTQGACLPYYEGCPGGPCYSGYGMPMPATTYGRNCSCGGRSVCYDGYGRAYTVNSCDYLSEENSAGCTVM